MSGEPYPIRPTALALENFRGWLGQHELDLSGDLTLLVGNNGSGKSGALNAIEWCLFGDVVARKSSGIDERGEWEVAHRRGEGFVSVTLTLETREGPARLTRRRPVDAKPRDPDSVRLELPGDQVLHGDEIEDWRRWNDLPDWDTWKHAFCQHQEQLRGRLLDTAARSAQLGALLGLEAYQELGELLKSLKANALAKAAQEELADLEGELQRALEQPRRELQAVEDQLERRGLARTEIDEPALAAHVERMIGEGHAIEQLLERETTLEGEAARTAKEVLHWARDLEPRLGGRRAEVERELSALRRELQELESTLAGIDPARRRWADASAAVKRWTELHGSKEELERQLGDLRRGREILQAEERERDARRQLLRQAADLLRPGAAECPVCGHHDPALVDELRRELAKTDDPLAERRNALDGREQQLSEQRKRLAELQSELEVAEGTHRSLQRALESKLPATGPDSKETPEELVRQRRSRITGLQGILGRLEEFFEAHRADTDVLELLLKWRAARARTDVATGGLDQLEEWLELQDAIDDAARLACDLEALGAMAREAQEERSVEQVREVNATLGQHLGRIRGVPGDDATRVVVRSTATKLTYHLVDANGRDVTPVLNQAALNALSFAMLFAQAEERARRGAPSWLVLDDPGQSLDAESLSGLAAAIAELAPRIPVLLATFPGPLADGLERVARASGHRYRLTAATPGAVPEIEEVRS